jgi:hypothetical protein
MEGEAALRFILWHSEEVCHAHVRIFPLLRGEEISGAIKLDKALSINCFGSWFIDVSRSDWSATVEAICNAAGVSSRVAGLALFRGLEIAMDHLNRGGPCVEEEEVVSA